MNSTTFPTTTWCGGPPRSPALSGSAVGPFSPGRERSTHAVAAPTRSGNSCTATMRTSGCASEWGIGGHTSRSKKGSRHDRPQGHRGHLAGSTSPAPPARLPRQQASARVRLRASDVRRSARDRGLDLTAIDRPLHPRRAADRLHPGSPRMEAHRRATRRCVRRDRGACRRVRSRRRIGVRRERRPGGWRRGDAARTRLPVRAARGDGRVGGG